MFFVLCLVVAALGVALYLLVIFRAVPGAVEERIGTLDVPADVGVWKLDDESPEGRGALAEGLRREVRFWLDDSGIVRMKLFRQTRYRSLATNEIVRVDPDERVALRRLRR